MTRGYQSFHELLMDPKASYFLRLIFPTEYRRLDSLVVTDARDTYSTPASSRSSRILFRIL